MYKSTQQTQTLQIHVQLQINIHNQTLTKPFIHTQFQIKQIYNI